MRKIVIIGGGTAGWMTASLLQHAWAKKGFSFEVIESADVQTVGVGEGSTPALKSFFDKLGITEQQWMPACHATYKCGIRFDNWSGRDGYDSYFHPFPSQLDSNTLSEFANNVAARRSGHSVQTQPDKFFLPALLAKQNKAPKENENFPFELSYGYHFDANKLAIFLREYATKKNVKHTVNHIHQVTHTNTGDIESVVGSDGEVFTADFFIDCSGFSSYLLQQQLCVPFVSYKDNLFNDAAVAISSEIEQDISSQTISTAMNYGWAWKIPLTSRVGNGYVYSSAHCDANQAETELRQKLNLLDSDVSVKHLKMKIGRVEKHWQKNCLAVGLSQGFIEPLEATALFLVQYTIEHFILAFEKGQYGNANQDTFNNIINRQFDGIRDYIVCHYKTSGRKDTEYWRACGANQILSPSLQQVFKVWMSGQNLASEIQKQNIDKFYTDVSWFCLLAGMGVFPKLQEELNTESTSLNLPQAQEFLRRCALNYPNHRDYLNNLSSG